MRQTHEKCRQRGANVSDDAAMTSTRDHASTARRDVVASGIIIVGIVMFIGTGGTAVSEAISALSGEGHATDRLLVSAFLLNIALLLFGYRRYRDLSIEVAERTAAEDRANALAVTDPLTGFYNRRIITDRAAEMIARAEKSGKTVAFMMLDLDNFKNVNDVHGHNSGDTVLREVARRIRTIISSNDLTARLGGDEFACAITFDPSSPELIDRIAEEIIDAISQPIVENGAHLIVTTSIGINRYDTDQEDVDGLMRRADIAMYSAKKQGRNRACWFDRSMEQELQTRNQLETGMRDGIPRGEFVPYFEQQVDLATGKLTGFEMLARWDSPTLGIVSPEVFIPIAEESGMIGDLSFDVMRKALDVAREWDPGLTISVNISPLQLLDPWLAQRIVKLLVETGFPAERLEVEITESSLFENLSLAQSIVGSLKNQNIRIALDDFGTGYSSLAHLRALPFDRIKIDRSFVASIQDNAESAAIVRAITGLGDSLGLVTTAEGIESADIEAELRDLGCGTGQGFHFGRPLSIAQTRNVLRQRGLLLSDPTATPDDRRETPLQPTAPLPITHAQRAAG